MLGGIYIALININYLLSQINQKHFFISFSLCGCHGGGGAPRAAPTAGPSGSLPLLLPSQLQLPPAPRFPFSQPLSLLSARLSPAAVHQELNALLGSSIIYWQNPAHSVRSEAPEPRPLGKPPIR